MAAGTNKNYSLHCESPQDEPMSLHLLLMIVEMIVGLPGNMLAMWIFCFRMKFWKSHTLYLFHLVLADFLVLIGVPFRLNTYLLGDNWVFGPVWCSINLFMLAVNRSASIAFMTTVALDRYFKVVHPFHSISNMTSTQAWKIVGLIWTLVIALRIPLLTINLLQQHGNLSLCRSFGSYREVPTEIKVHYTAYTVEFFLPWFLLLFCAVRITCYLRQRKLNQHKMVRKAIIAVGVICFVFTICFLPSIVTGLGGIVIKTFYPTDCESYILITRLFQMSISFTYMNSALDPVIYSFSSSMFRDTLRSSMSCLGVVKKNVRSTKSVASDCNKVNDVDSHFL